MAIRSLSFSFSGSGSNISYTKSTELEADRTATDGYESMDLAETKDTSYPDVTSLYTQLAKAKVNDYNALYSISNFTTEFANVGTYDYDTVYNAANVANFEGTYDVVDEGTDVYTIDSSGNVRDSQSTSVGTISVRSPYYFVLTVGQTDTPYYSNDRVVFGDLAGAVWTKRV